MKTRDFSLAEERFCGVIWSSVDSPAGARSAAAGVFPRTLRAQLPFRNCAPGIWVILLLAVFIGASPCLGGDTYVHCNGLAYFLQDPTNLNACVSSSPTLTAQVHPGWDLIIPSGGGNNQYVAILHQIIWRLNGTNIPGASQLTYFDPPNPATISLTLSNATSLQSGLYDVIVSNYCNSATSHVAQASVGPNVLTPPQNTTGQVAQAVSLSVVAAGPGPLGYQWRLDGSNLVDGAKVSGSQTSVLNLGPPLLYWQDGNYDVVVTDNCGLGLSVTSSVAKVTVAPGWQWVFRTTNGPAARFAEALAYDSIRGVTMLFGGGTISGGLYVPCGDVWEWNGAQWSQRMTYSPTSGWFFVSSGGSWIPDYQTVPVPRLMHAMAFDSHRGRVVMFGGRSTTPAGSDFFLGDTWEWNGVRWYFRTTNGPVSRLNPAMAYDSDRGVTVLYGGFLSTSEAAGVWEWDGNLWTERLATNGPSTSYYQNEDATAYDSFRKETFLGPTTDGFFLDNFWNWNGASWSYEGTGFGSITSPGYGAMDFDSYCRRCVYFGGTGPSSATAIWDGRNWTLLGTSLTTPPARQQTAMTFHENRHASVMMGGNAGSNLGTNDTWELQAVDLPLINDQPASQFLQPAQTATFTVSAVGPGTLVYQWLRNGTPLGNGGRIAGADTTMLSIGNITVADAALYSVLVSNACGVTTSRSAILTLNLTLQIFSSANSVTLLWGATNVALQMANSPSGPWSDVPGATSPFDIGLFPTNDFFRLKIVGP